MKNRIDPRTLILHEYYTFYHFRCSAQRLSVAFRRLNYVGERAAKAFAGLNTALKIYPRKPVDFISGWFLVGRFFIKKALKRLKIKP